MWTTRLSLRLSKLLARFDTLAPFAFRRGLHDELTVLVAELVLQKEDVQALFFSYNNHHRFM